MQSKIKNQALKDLPARNRLRYFFIIIFVVLLGLFSRSRFTPEIIYPYIGDAFYALMMYFIVAFLRPASSPKTVFLAALAICFAIEFSQLYQADWLNHIRSNKIGALVLGHGFLWSDLLAYLFGALVGFLLESWQGVGSQKTEA